MVCKSLLLPLMAGLTLCANNAFARGNALRQQPVALKSLSFIENKGQIVDQFREPRPDIDFKLAASNGLNIFIGGGALHYQWASSMDSGQLRVDNENAESGHNMPCRKAGNGPGASGENAGSSPAFRMYRMDVTLVGANKDAKVIAEGKQQYYERYFQPRINKSNSNEGIIAHSYQKITYRNVYPDIDWVLYISGAKVEYDFVVRPGGKVSDIKLKYGGASALKINANGSLTATTPMGSVTEQMPKSYQEDGANVVSHFVLKNGELSFKTGSYEGTLTIDPTLEWATYFGDLGEDIAYDMSSDNNDNIFMIGATSSIANIATTGSFQSSFAGGSCDVFLTKFSSLGDCVWSTYFGGTAEDRGTGIVSDPLTNSLYIAGVTKSTSGIATTGTFQDTLGGNFDAFLARFDTSGARIWCSYYGGSGSEGSGLKAETACDKAGNVFLCGVTASDNNIATTGSHQSLRAGNSDAFLAGFDSTGQRQWGTYFGGADNDSGSKVACDTSGNIYMGGVTSSASGIATGGAYQTVAGGGNDAFIAKFNATGVLQWSTYFGGSASETFAALAAHADGTAYIAGGTGSTGLATAGTHQDTLNGIMDGYLASFSNNGQLNWATYLGGEAPDFINALTLDDQAVYAGGLTASLTGISTPGAYQDTANAFPAFIVSFDNSGQRNWGTYYGGSGADWINSMLITPAQRLFIAGQTYSGTDLATPGSFQSNFGGGTWDAFLTKFNVCETPQQPGAIMGDTVLCSGQEYTFSADTVAGALSYTWTLPNGWAGSSDSSGITIIPDENSGTITVAANNSCATGDSITLNVTVNASPEPVIENNNNTLSTTQPYSSYQWNRNGQAINGATAGSYTVTANGDYSVTVTNDNGCSGTSDTLVLSGVGIAELQGLAEAISVYPNPTADVVRIQSPVAVDVKVMSIEGRMLLAVKNAKEVSLKDLAAGMYWLRIYDGEGRLVKVGKVVRK